MSDGTGDAPHGGALRIALVGHGRMGQAIEALARERGHAIHAIVDAGEGLPLSRERLAGADVAIEFTVPHAAPGNLAALVEYGIPVVTGTTGWLDELPRIAALVERHGGALLHAANFSIGVQLFLKTATELARRFAGRPEFGAAITETHHVRKLDAPSGTALALEAALRAGDAGRQWPIASVRVGHVPGTHVVQYDGPFEQVTLAHEARDRRVFAMGALAAAEWLPGRRGVFTFDQMLFGSEA